ncbi:hypothetical protein CYMTET_7296, partial [Cymbomonas tetramitiformis]
VAMEEARRMGARVVHGDRNIDITMQRLQSSLRDVDFTKVLRSTVSVQPTSPLRHVNLSNMFTEETVEAMKTREAASEMMNMTKQVLPEAVRVIRDERDEFMVEKLLACSGRVVAVVGIGHMDGIEKLWGEAMQKPKVKK